MPKNEINSQGQQLTMMKNAIEERIASVKNELAILETERKTKLDEGKELNAEKKEEYLKLASMKGFYEGQLTAINNGFTDKDSINVFGCVNSMAERMYTCDNKQDLLQNQHTNMDDTFKQYGPLSKKLDRLRRRMENTFCYEDADESSVLKAVSEIKNELEENIISRISEKSEKNNSPVFFNSDVRDIFGSEFIGELNNIKLGKEEEEEEINLGNAHDLLKKAAKAATDAHNDENSSAYKKYVFLLREIQLRDSHADTKIQLHFEDMLSTNDEETLKKNKALLSKAAKTFYDDKTTLENHINAEHDACKYYIQMREMASWRKNFTSQEKKLVIRQGSAEINKEFKPFVTNPIAGKLLIEQDIAKADKKKKPPFAYQAIKISQKILGHLHTSAVKKTDDQEFINGIEKQKKPIDIRIKQINNVQKSIDEGNFPIDMKKADNGDIEYIKVSLDRNNKHSLKITHSLTDFFTFKQNLIAGAKDFMEKIKQTTSPNAKHTAEYNYLHNALQEVTQIKDETSIPQVYARLSDLHFASDRYTSSKENKTIFSSSGKKRAEIVRDIKEFDTKMLEKFKKAINTNDPLFIKQLEKCDRVKFKNQTPEKIQTGSNDEQQDKTQPDKTLKDDIREFNRIKELTNKEFTTVYGRLKEKGIGIFKKDGKDRMYTLLSEIKDLTDGINKSNQEEIKTREDLSEQIARMQKSLKTIAVESGDMLNQRGIVDYFSIFMSRERELKDNLVERVNHNALWQDNRLQELADRAPKNFEAPKENEPNNQPEDNNHPQVPEKEDWIIRMSRQAGTFQGQLDFITEKTKKLVNQLDATLPAEKNVEKKLSGRSKEFQALYKALQEVSQNKADNFEELSASITKLKEAAENYYQLQAGKRHRSAGQKRLDAASEVINLHLGDFLQLKDAILSTGILQETDNPSDLESAVKNLENLRRKNDPDVKIKEAKDKLFSSSTNKGAIPDLMKAAGSYGKNKENEGQLRACLKTCFDLKTSIKIEQRKKQNQSISDLSIEFPGEVLDYMKEQNILGSFVQKHANPKSYQEKQRENQALKDLKEKVDALGNKWMETMSPLNQKATKDALDEIESKLKKIDVQDFKDFKNFKRKCKEKNGEITYQHITEYLLDKQQEISNQFNENYERIKELQKAKNEESDEGKKNDQEQAISERNDQKDALLKKAKEINELIPKAHWDSMEALKEYKAKKEELDCMPEYDTEIRQDDVDKCTIDTMTDSLRKMGSSYSKYKIEYAQKITELEKAKEDLGEGNFKVALRNILELRHNMNCEILKTAMGEDAYERSSQKEAEKAEYEAVKAGLNNFKAISLSYSMDKMIEMLKDPNKSSEFVSIIAGYQKKEVKDKDPQRDNNPAAIKWGDEPAVKITEKKDPTGSTTYDYEWNENAIRHLDNQLKAVINNNRISLQELSKDYESAKNGTNEAKEALRRQASDCVNQIIEASAAVIALNQIKLADPQDWIVKDAEGKKKSLSLNELMNKRTMAVDNDNQPIQEGMIDRVRHSEDFMRLLKECQEQNKKQDKKQDKNETPFAAVTHLAELVMNKTGHALNGAIRETASPFSNKLFSLPAYGGFDLTIDFNQPSFDVKLDVDAPGEMRIPPKGSKNENENEKYKASLELEKKKLEAEERSLGKILNIYGKEYKNLKEMEQEGDDQSYLNAVCKMVLIIGKKNDNDTKRNIANNNLPNTTQKMDSSNKHFEENPKELESAVSTLCLQNKPSVIIDMFKDKSILRSINPLLTKPVLQDNSNKKDNSDQQKASDKKDNTDKQKAANNQKAADKPNQDLPLNKMTYEERQAQINETKALLSLRCQRNLELYTQKIEEMNQLRKKGKTADLKKARTEYDSIVKESLHDIAILTAISNREVFIEQKKKQMEQKNEKVDMNAIDPFAANQSTWDRLVSGGIRVENNGEKTGVVEFSRGALARSMVVRNEFRYMLEQSGALNDDDPRTKNSQTIRKNGLGMLLQSAACENDTVRKELEEGKKDVPRLQDLMKAARSKFKHNVLDSVLSPNAHASGDVRDANKSFVCEGVKIDPSAMGYSHKINNTDNRDDKQEIQNILDCKDEKLSDLQKILKSVKEHTRLHTLYSSEVERFKRNENKFFERMRERDIHKVETLEKTIPDEKRNALKTCNDLLGKLDPRKDAASRGLVKALRDKLDPNYGKETDIPVLRVKMKIAQLETGFNGMSNEYPVSAEDDLVTKMAAELVVCEAILKGSDINTTRSEYIEDMLDPLRFAKEVQNCQNDEKFTELINSLSTGAKLKEWAANIKKDLAITEKFEDLEKQLQQQTNDPQTGPMEEPQTNAQHKSKKALSH